LKNRVLSIIALVAVLCSMALVSTNVAGASALAQATPDAKKSNVVAKVIAAELSLRASPSIRAQRLKILKAADALSVIGKTNNGFWYQVNTSDNVTGWVGSAYVAITTGKDADVPVVDASLIPDPEACTPVTVPGRVNSVEGLALRTQPSTAAEKLVTLPAGTGVTVIGQNTAGTWLLVTTNDKKTGWVGSAYVFVTNKARLSNVPFVDPSATAATPPPGCTTSTAPVAEGTEAATTPQPTSKVATAKVIVNELRVRANPSTEADTLKILKAAESVSISAQTENGQWFQVETSDGIIGWIGSAFVKLDSGKISDIPKIQPAPVG